MLAYELNVIYGVYQMKTKWHKKKRALNFVVVVTFLLQFSGCNKQSEEQSGGFPPPAVSIAEVIVREVTPWQEFSGRIEAKETVHLRPRVGGVVEKIHYREGEIVDKGDLLFVLDQAPFRAELNRAEAQLVQARTQAELAKVESKRAENLVSRNLLSEDEYDRRVATENEANASVLSAEATVKLARLNLGYTSVRSPIHGRSGRALVTKGNLVMSDPTPDQLTTIHSLDPVYVVFDVDELTYLQFFPEYDLSDQRKVFVGFANEEGFSRQGYVDFINNQVSPDTGTMRMRAVLENKDHKITPGLFARVKLFAQQSQKAILISDDAIMTDQDRKYVYVVEEDNLAKRRDITIGKSIEGLRTVNTGLSLGDRVIVYGTQKVFFPNMPVEPHIIQMGDPPASPMQISSPDH